MSWEDSAILRKEVKRTADSVFKLNQCLLLKRLSPVRSAIRSALSKQNGVQFCTDDCLERNKKTTCDDCCVGNNIIMTMGTQTQFSVYFPFLANRSRLMTYLVVYVYPTFQPLNNMNNFEGI